MKCVICGNEFNHLGLHLKLSHNMNQSEYHDKYIKSDKCIDCCKQGDNCLFCEYETIVGKIICPVCGKYVKRIGAHVTHSHKEYTQKEFYDEYLKRAEEGVCQVCGKPTTFVNMEVGYNIHCDRYCERRSNSKTQPDTRPPIHTCKLCGLEVKSYSSLGHHLKNQHQITTKDYYDQYCKQNPQDGVCKTCGKESIFVGFSRGGYSPYCSLKCANSNKEKCQHTNQKIREKFNGGWIPLDEKTKRNMQRKRRKSLIEHFGENYGSVITQKGQSKREQTNLDKYGVTSPLGSVELREKGKQTSLERYGVETPASSKKIQRKIRKTMKERYGVEFAQQNEQIKEKTAETFNARYGGVGWASPIILEKTIETNQKRYGCSWPTQSKEVRKKIRQTAIRRYGTLTPHAFGSKEFKASMLKKYGVENSMHVPEIKAKEQDAYIKNNGGLFGASPSVQEKIHQTSLDKYGTDRPVQSEHVQNKIKETNVERYGAENVFASDVGKQKIKESLIKTYGVDNIQKLPQVREKAVKTWKENLKQNNQLDKELGDADE